MTDEVNLVATKAQMDNEDHIVMTQVFQRFIACRRGTRIRYIRSDRRIELLKLGQQNLGIADVHLLALQVLAPAGE